MYRWQLLPRDEMPEMGREERGIRMRSRTRKGLRCWAEGSKMVDSTMGSKMAGRQGRDLNPRSRKAGRRLSCPDEVPHQKTNRGLYPSDHQINCRLGFHPTSSGTRNTMRSPSFLSCSMSSSSSSSISISYLLHYHNLYPHSRSVSLTPPNPTSTNIAEND